MKYLIYLIIFFVGIKSYSQFSTPIAGKYLEDYFIVNYFDHSKDSIVIDYNCLKKTYKSNLGTDFIIKSFKAMDDSIPVLAANDGIVVLLIDSLFDRNMDLTEKGLGNYICISHPSKYFAYYANLRKNSARVQLGSSVKRGDTIAFVGSSGYSSDPRLHFELWKDNLPLDPFMGNCNKITKSLWLTDLIYKNDLFVFDKGFSNANLDLVQLKERTGVKDKFIFKDTTITFWTLLSGIKKDDKIKVEWLNSNNDLFYSAESISDTSSNYYYWWSSIPFPKNDSNGVWTLKYYINNNILLTENFTVDNIVGVNEFINPEFSIKENNSSISIHLNNQISSVQVYNLSGELIETSVNLAQDYYLEKAKYPTGIYFIKVIDILNHSYFRKILIY
jgi:hypothetical protein